MIQQQFSLGCRARRFNVAPQVVVGWRSTWEDVVQVGPNRQTSEWGPHSVGRCELAASLPLEVYITVTCQGKHFRCCGEERRARTSTEQSTPLIDFGTALYMLPYANVATIHTRRDTERSHTTGSLPGLGTRRLHPGNPTCPLQKLVNVADNLNLIRINIRLFLLGRHVGS